MPEDESRVLPEGTPVDDFVDDPVFTEVTANGEVYTLFRIVRVTHLLRKEKEIWTHRANVTRVRDGAIGTALLYVVDRIIEDAAVTIATIPY